MSNAPAPQHPTTPTTDPANTAWHENAARVHAHQCSPTPGPLDNLNHTHNKSCKKANINIATLNINGFRSGGNNLEKWSMVNQTLNKHKIAILALQEMHLDQEHVDKLSRSFGKKMDIRFSADSDAPCATAEVAFIINKSLITPQKITTHEIIVGKALNIKVEWLDNETSSFMNIYAPNARAAHENFWQVVDKSRRDLHVPIPNFLLGDFNVTEDPIDQLPTRLDDPNTIEALRNTRLVWGINDAWRMTYPENKEFTY